MSKPAPKSKSLPKFRSEPKEREFGEAPQNDATEFFYPSALAPVTFKYLKGMSV